MVNVLALSDYWWGWLGLGFRWLHVIAAMAWIGASFYFIALDNHLEPPRDPDDARRGVGGEAWEVHGGGFYRVEKFRVAPERLPEPLHWFKWEAYTTWLSGFALFIAVYYSHASSFLIDTSVADLTAWEAIAISIAGLVHRLARLRRPLSRVPQRRRSARGSRLRVHRRLVVGSVEPLCAARRVPAGRRDDRDDDGGQCLLRDHPGAPEARARQGGRREPDPRWNRDGKTRSVHNNYLTLPVVFAMLSGHFPFTYGYARGWLVLVAIMALGALIRHYFNLRQRGLNAWPILGVAAAGMLAVALLIR